MDFEDCIFQVGECPILPHGLSTGYQNGNELDIQSQLGNYNLQNPFNTLKKMKAKSITRKIQRRNKNSTRWKYKRMVFPNRLLPIITFKTKKADAWTKSARFLENKVLKFFGVTAPPKVLLKHGITEEQNRCHALDIKPDNFKIVLKRIRGIFLHTKQG